MAAVDTLEDKRAQWNKTVRIGTKFRVRDSGTVLHLSEHGMIPGLMGRAEIGHLRKRANKDQVDQQLRVRREIQSAPVDRALYSY